MSEQKSTLYVEQNNVCIHSFTPSIELCEDMRNVAYLRNNTIYGELAKLSLIPSLSFFVESDNDTRMWKDFKTIMMMLIATSTPTTHALLDTGKDLVKNKLYMDGDNTLKNLLQKYDYIMYSSSYYCGQNIDDYEKKNMNVFEKIKSTIHSILMVHNPLQTHCVFTNDKCVNTTIIFTNTPTLIDKLTMIVIDNKNKSMTNDDKIISLTKITKHDDDNDNDNDNDIVDDDIIDYDNINNKYATFDIVNSVKKNNMTSKNKVETVITKTSNLPKFYELISSLNKIRFIFMIKCIVVNITTLFGLHRINKFNKFTIIMVVLVNMLRQFLCLRTINKKISKQMYNIKITLRAFIDDNCALNYWFFDLFGNMGFTNSISRCIQSGAYPNKIR
jgi:hypothetical protein